jgi:hypothetical protein
MAGSGFKAKTLIPMLFSCLYQDRTVYSKTHTLTPEHRNLEGRLNLGVLLKGEISEPSAWVKWTWRQPFLTHIS